MVPICDTHAHASGCFSGKGTKRGPKRTPNGIDLVHSFTPGHVQMGRKRRDVAVAIETDDAF